MNKLFCQILLHSIFKRGYYIYFPFSCDFFIEIFKEKDAFLKLEFLLKIDWIKLFYSCCIKYNSDTLQWDRFPLILFFTLENRMVQNTAILRILSISQKCDFSAFFQSPHNFYK